MYYFTDFFRDQLIANQNILDGAHVRVVLFRYAPSLEFIQDRWVGVQTVDDLLAFPGWSEVTAPGYPLVTWINGSTRPISGSRYMTFSAYPFSDLTEPVEVEAIGFVYSGSLGGVTDPLMFVTTSPVGPVVTNIYPGDSLTANPDSTFPDTTNRWLMSWAVSRPDPIEGPLEFFRAPPTFEVSGSQHVWLYPQRANMIANPSFEKPGVAHWAGNGDVTRVSGGGPGMNRVIKGELDDSEDLPAEGKANDHYLIDGEVWSWNTLDADPAKHKWVNTGSMPAASAWAGQVAGVNGLCVLESNQFPTRLGEHDSDQWTIQLHAKGEGLCKVGLVSWDPDYRATMVDWGTGGLASSTTDDEETESWRLSPDAWTHIATHRHAPQAHVAMVRIEARGATLTVDQVLAERGYLKDWLYFDGDNTYGARDDFSWYGGTNRKGDTYSLWYNNKKAVRGRLFARNVDPNDPALLVTDENMEEQGLVYRWVPAGITVTEHFDVFYPHDLALPVPIRPDTVLPYFDQENPDGVINPWPPTVVQHVWTTTAE